MTQASSWNRKLLCKIWARFTTIANLPHRVKGLNAALQTRCVSTECRAVVGTKLTWRISFVFCVLSQGAMGRKEKATTWLSSTILFARWLPKRRSYRGLLIAFFQFMINISDLKFRIRIHEPEWRLFRHTGLKNLYIGTSCIAIHTPFYLTGAWFCSRLLYHLFMH